MAGLAVHLLYFTAQRIGDVLALRWSDILGGRIVLTQQKARTELSIPIHRDLLNELDAISKKGMTIVTRDNGGKLSTDMLRPHLQAGAAKHSVKLCPMDYEKRRERPSRVRVQCGCNGGDQRAVFALSSFTPSGARKE